jgi:uncharacterized RDD family membrane protein YckC
MLYEGVLLFGILFISAWLFSTLLQQRNAMYLRQPLEVWLFFVVGIYYIWCWTHGGQTLPMKTWRMRVVTKEGAPLTPWRALARYLFAWLWFVPGLAIASAMDAQGWMLVLPPAVNFVVWAATALFDKDRQFLHDRLAGTRLVVAA